MYLRAASSLALGCRGCLRSSSWFFGGIRPIPLEYSRANARRTLLVQHCNPLSTLSHNQAVPKADDPTSHNFTLIYTFPPIKFLRGISRLKLVQTGITLLILPPVYYLYFQGEVTYFLVSYSTGIAAFAAIMLYSFSHYLRRFVGMMYLDYSKTTLKVSHLTFWGKRHDLYIPVNDVMTIADTGDSRNETLLSLKRYSCPDTLYISTWLGRVVDKEAFKQVFGSSS